MCFLSAMDWTQKFLRLQRADINPGSTWLQERIHSCGARSQLAQLPPSVQMTWLPSLSSGGNRVCHAVPGPVGLLPPPRRHCNNARSQVALRVALAVQEQRLYATKHLDDETRVEKQLDGDGSAKEGQFKAGMDYNRFLGHALEKEAKKRAFITAPSFKMPSVKDACAPLSWDTCL